MTAFSTTHASRTFAATIAFSVIVANLIAKLLIERYLPVGDSWWLIEDAIGLERVENGGIAFGVDFGSGTVVTLVVLAALLVLVWLVASGMTGHSWSAMLSAGLVLGGAFGNAIDRFPDGTVTDYVAFWSWPRFNIADAALTIGIAALLLVEIRASRQAPK